MQIPDDLDRGIISLCHSYLFGGFIKEKYKKDIATIFQRNLEAATGRLAGTLGGRIAERLVRSVAAGDDAAALALLPSARRALLVRSFKCSPWRSLQALLRHHASELAIIANRGKLSTVVVLGADGAGKSSVLDEASEGLKGATKNIRLYHLRRELLYRRRGQGGPVTDPHALAPRGRLTSAAKVLLWGVESWLDRLLLFERNATLRLFDRYYHDLLVDPRRYRYGGPMWLARLVGRLIPKPDLWILLDAPAEVLQARKPEVTFEESARQREAYLALVRGFPNAVVVDATRPLGEVVARVKEAVLSLMAERTRRRLERKPWTRQDK
jgi:thymidylate kinase